MAQEKTARLDDTRLSARKRLLNTADDLFYRRGIRGVGIDEVIREAGVAKASLYRAFPSKDDLIVAYLDERHRAFWQAWDEELAGVTDPDEAFRVAIDFLCRAIEDPTYRGCPFANFSVEFPERGHPARILVERSKQETRSRLASLVKARIGSAPHIADALFLLLEGAFSLSQTMEGGAPEAGRMFAQSTALLFPDRGAGGIRQSD